jgi:hypothetical protein
MTRRLAVAALLLVPVSLAAQQSTPHDSLTAAVQTIDARAHTIDLTYGVGMALHAVRLRVVPDTRITASGTPLQFTALQPGDVVRVSFGSRPGGDVAYSIALIGKMAPDGTP